MVGITGCGKYVPKNRILNSDLARECGVSAEWIEERTGIQSRYYAGEQETTAMMGTAAAQQALERAEVKAGDVGLIISCTYSGEYRFPPAACKIQQNLKLVRAGAFDLSSGSAGFEAAIILGADRLRAEPELKNVLIVTAAVQSPFLDKKDANTAVIFGDGAAAAVLSNAPKGYGLLSSAMLSRGTAFEAIRLKDAPEAKIEMDGLTVGKHYLKEQPALIEQVLKKAGLKQQDIDLFIFHQANLKIIQALMAKMKLDLKKTFTNVEIYGNTSDASVALALCEAVETGRIKRGDRVLLSGVGAGMTFAAAILRWY